MNGQKVSSGNEVVPTRWTSVLPADRLRPARVSNISTAGGHSGSGNGRGRSSREDERAVGMKLLVKIARPRGRS